MIKVITFSLHDFEIKKIHDKEIGADYILEHCCTIQEYDKDSLDFFKEGWGKAGERCLVMNNSDTIIYAPYSAMVSFELDKMGINLERLLFKKVMQELGFERKY